MRYLATLSTIFILTIPGCATNQTSTTKITDPRPCVKNLSSVGSFWSSRTFKTFQDFSGISRSRAFNQLAPALAGGGWTISSSSKESGVITAWAKPNYAEGETESLNAVVRSKGTAGIRVELTYIAPAMAIVPESTLNDQLCSILASVESARK